MKKFVLFLLMSMSLVAVQAQEKIAVTAADYSNNEVEMADLMRSEGKIYVLVGVICLLYTSPSPRDRQKSRMPSSA